MEESKQKSWVRVHYFLSHRWISLWFSWLLSRELGWQWPSACQLESWGHWHRLRWKGHLLTHRQEVGPK
jgi:hypothetical protein